VNNDRDREAVFIERLRWDDESIRTEAHRCRRPPRAAEAAAETKRTADFPLITAAFFIVRRLRWWIVLFLYVQIDDLIERELDVGHSSAPFVLGFSLNI